MAAMELSTLFVDYSHLIYWSEKNVLGFSEAITERHYRFLPFLRRGLEACIRRHEPEYWGKAGRGAGGGEGVSPTIISFLKTPLLREGVVDHLTPCSCNYFNMVPS